MDELCLEGDHRAGAVFRRGLVGDPDSQVPDHLDCQSAVFATAPRTRQAPSGQRAPHRQCQTSHSACVPSDPGARLRRSCARSGGSRYCAMPHRAFMKLPRVLSRCWSHHPLAELGPPLNPGDSGQRPGQEYRSVIDHRARYQAAHVNTATRDPETFSGANNGPVSIDLQNRTSAKPGVSSARRHELQGRRVKTRAVRYLYLPRRCSPASARHNVLTNYS